ncbi:MAG: site-specific DNA-methyltransferase, partial [Acidobacteria bacterium]|nr:site-specific DNA-methyltransferase [Acidobacteriota bacterium]
MPARPKQYSLAMAPAGVQKRAPHKPFVPGPNPDLPDFIARHSIPYDPASDRYDVPAFDRDLEVNKAHPPKAIYDMHTYWSKKHWAAIREYIRHYLPEKHYPRGTGLVLDCFAGSGMTGVAAMMEDRPCVLIDASPAAAFISHCYTHPVDPDELREAYERMMTDEYRAELRRKLKVVTGEDIRNLQQELDWLYETRCDRCNGPATTEYVVHSERFQCPACAEIVALCDCREFDSPKKGRYCPYCVARRHGEPHRDFLISTRSKKFGAVPVLVSYKCLGGCKPA